MQCSLIRRLTMTLITIAVAALPVSAQVELPDPVYQVSMSASYEPETQLVQGSERIRWKNTSSVPVDELQFHLYLNAFANDRSTFMLESGGQLRDVEIPKDWSQLATEVLHVPAPPPTAPSLPAGIWLSTLLLAATMIVISSTLSLGFYARKDEIEILRLVGASESYIKLPFFWEAMLQGMGGAVAALGILWLIFLIFHMFTPAVQYLYDVSFPAVENIRQNT